MGIQMYIVAQRRKLNPETSVELQRFVHDAGGLILMNTNTGLVIAIEDQQAATIATHPLVAFMGPVSINPRGLAAARLRDVFASNLSRQLDLTKLGDLQSPQAQAGG